MAKKPKMRRNQSAKGRRPTPLVAQTQPSSADPEPGSCDLLKIVALAESAHDDLPWSKQISQAAMVFCEMRLGSDHLKTLTDAKASQWVTRPQTVSNLWYIRP
ncbi:MAG: hypothetical protein LBR11_00280 [Deltaproteobacteria bacterium]|jgi:hypothetical protein|nr:hypothetical protein [Deltaproteobacteria bacterium]